MAADIKQDLGTDCEMITGAGGIFDVKVNGDLVYSKHQTGEFPEHAPLIEKIKSKTTA